MCTPDKSTNTQSVVTDYFGWRLKNKTITNNRLFNIIRKIAADCEASYYTQQAAFKFHFSSSIIDLQNIHREIANELFNDGIITWTRIITFISFSAILAEYFIQEKKQVHNMDFLISSIIDWTTNSIDNNLRTWLESQNYWHYCWICMELMDTSLGNLYKFAYRKLDQFILGDILAYIALVSTTTIKIFNSAMTNQIFDLTSARSYDQNQKPNYKELLENPFLRQEKEPQQTEYIVAYLSDIIDGLQLNMDKS
ncbi:unnamed protein product [Rotaria sp. Silwood1]|nr:unnamed protein product [Rotaria sp. Silwood1]CAF4941688.1 unnamed protein product [Rotaria sp. Silwood1]